jgi:hypothetical protein
MCLIVNFVFSSVLLILFVVYITLLSVAWTIQCQMRQIMNCKGYERKWPWPNLRHHPGICLEGLNKITTCQDSQSLDQDLKPESPKYESSI